MLIERCVDALGDGASTVGRGQLIVGRRELLDDPPMRRARRARRARRPLRGGSVRGRSINAIAARSGEGDESVGA